MTPVGAAVERSVRIHVDHLLETLQGLPREAFNTWKPAAAREGSHEMNTFAALAVHTVSAAEFHALHMVGRKASDRDRDSEFVATATYEDVEARFRTFLAELHELLDGMSDADFGGDPAPDRPDLEGWTNADWLMHTIDHIALHTGHLQIQRQLWEYESGSA
ncbi:MAG TPA: DinB family protein [Thermomicrobiales bacterium]|nr:DinB family protein [Thermomicrobiales bacterium]